MKTSAVRSLTQIGVALMATIAGFMVPATLGSTATADAAANCASVTFIGARGSGEAASSSTQNLGAEVDQMAQQLQIQLLPGGLGLQVRAVNYPAVSTNVLKPSGGEEAAFLVDPTDAIALWKLNHLDVFLASIDQGIQVAVTEVKDAVKACPNSLLVLAGYSQGAMVIHQAELQLASDDHGLLSHIAGTILLADGDRVPHTAAAKTLGSSPAGGEGIRPYLHMVSVRDVPLPASTVDICNNHDFICDFNLDSLPNFGSDVKVHTSYSDGSLPAQAADWVGQLILRNNHITPTPSPAGGPSGGSAPGSGPGAGSPQPAPQTYPETSGSVVHTWTDYANAGGTEGPEISSNDTVQIACKVSGFRVEDGNTWWYLVASSPWNGAYYASADAFYNNGQTSGSLIGTPFVDAAVPDCSGGDEAPGEGEAPGESEGPSSNAFAETSGSVVHTWSDYADAGGSEGPEMPSNDTVRIACKVNGFTVADGNAWWYRIASAPWNGDYYGSADAFYNDGATSGSLLGTPFVDPNVPNC